MWTITAISQIGLCGPASHRSHRNACTLRFSVAFFQRRCVMSSSSWSMRRTRQAITLLLALFVISCGLTVVTRQAHAGEQSKALADGLVQEWKKGGAIVGWMQAEDGTFD